MTYVPGVGSTGRSMPAGDVPIVEGPERVLPSGFSTVRLPPESVDDVRPMLRRWPAVPSKLTRARCPARGMVTGSDEPPTVIVALIASESSKSKDSVFAYSGSSTIVYVPVTGKGSQFTVPSVATKPPVTNVEPSGLVTVSVSWTNDAELLCRLSRCPAVPLKVVRARWPGRVMFAVTDGPPTTSGPTDRSCDSVTVMLPEYEPCGLIRSSYVPVTGSEAMCVSPPKNPTGCDDRMPPSGLYTVMSEARRLTLMLLYPSVTCCPTVPSKTKS